MQGTRLRDVPGKRPGLAAAVLTVLLCWGTAMARQEATEPGGPPDRTPDQAPADAAISETPVAEPGPSPLDAQKQKIEALRASSAALRERRQLLQEELQPDAEPPLPADEKNLAEAELTVVESELQALKVRLKAEELALAVLEQSQERDDHREAMAEAAESATAEDQASAARRLLVMSEGLLEGLEGLVDAWSPARDEYQRHLQVLKRTIADMQVAHADEQHLKPFRSRAEEISAEIDILQKHLESAAQEQEILRKQLPSLQAQLEAAQERLAEGAEPTKPAEEEREEKAEEPAEAVAEQPAPAAPEELKAEAERKEAEAERAEREAAVLEEEAERAKELAVQKRTWEETLERELEIAQAAVERLKEEGASQQEITAAEERVSSLEATLGAARETISRLERDARQAAQQAREKLLDAELRRKQAEAQEARLREEEARRRSRWITSIATAIVAAVITLALATVVKRLVKRKELWTLQDEVDEEKIRRIRTPFLMIRRVVVPLIYFAGTIIILMQFEAFRRLGTTFLASAGVAGIVVGMAARSTLANAVAGIMLCFSQPVRVGDTVTIGGEYGTIEEIGLMYTTFKTWDNRRVMIPNEIMADKEVVNYTIRDNKIWAKVPIHLDYSADVRKAREVLIDIVKKSQHWNGQEEPVVWFMELGEQTITLWVAAWADNPAEAWGLKCDILDNALVRFKEEGVALPRRRYQYEGVRVMLEPGKGPTPNE